MKTKAIIVDLDNTIYPADSISRRLFEDIYQLLQERLSPTILAQVKDEMRFRPFQKVAERFSLASDLRRDIDERLRRLTWKEKMQPYPDYTTIQKLPLKKFLVTSGYPDLQNSKIDQLGIRKDFSEIFILDPGESDRIKKNVFSEIINNYSFHPKELLVVGDDPESEIAGAIELGIPAVLYNAAERNFQEQITAPIIRNFYEIEKFIHKE